MTDIIVVGAGVGGCQVARAAAEGGASVLLIEKRQREDIGDKISYDSIKPQIFDELGIPHPEGAELDDTGTKLRLYAPNKIDHLDCDVPNLLVHRGLLGKRLLGYAEQAGVQLLDRATVNDVIVEDDRLVGVQFVRGGETEEHRSSVVIDAGGFFAPVRHRLPESIYPRYRIARQQLVTAYREVRPAARLYPTLCPPEDFDGYYDFLGYDGGYLWIVREGDGLLNVGIGVLDLPHRRGPTARVQDFAKDNPAVGDEVILQGHGGSPYIPLRTVQPQLVGNGFMAVGDAAWQVCPGTGYGVYPALTAGQIAGMIAAQAVRQGDTSKNGLWPYAVRWHHGLGADFGFIDCIRVMLQSIPNDDLDFLFEQRIVDAEMFSKIWLGEPFSLSPVRTPGKALRGLGKVGLLMKLCFALRLARRFHALHKHFPENPVNFLTWEGRHDQLYQQLHKRLDVKLDFSKDYGPGMLEKIETAPLGSPPLVEE